MNIPVSLNGKSVHIVDGDEDMRKAYDRIFRVFAKAGAIVRLHDSPAAFLNAVTPDLLPDVLISGYVFDGGLSGVQLGDRLKREGFRGSFLLVTGYRGYETSGSVDAVIEKPFDVTRLKEKVLSLLVD